MSNKLCIEFSESFVRDIDGNNTRGITPVPCDPDDLNQIQLVRQSDVQQFGTGSTLSLTSQQGLEIAGAVVTLWALAFAGRVLIQAIKPSKEDENVS